MVMRVKAAIRRENVNNLADHCLPCQLRLLIDTRCTGVEEVYQDGH